jgi:hypothetical protein
MVPENHAGEEQPFDLFATDVEGGPLPLVF